MKIHYPSGTRTDTNGIPFLLPKYWTAEQALAVFELLQDLQAGIYAHYGSQMMEVLREERGDSTLTEEDIARPDGF